MKGKWMTATFAVIILLAAAGLSAVGGQDMEKQALMKVIRLQTVIGEEGKEKQIEPLFDGRRRKLVQITLRKQAVLDAHTAPEPITIQCIAGKGTLLVGDPGQAVELTPGVLVTIEPGILHEIRAQSEVSILLTKFMEK